MRAGSSSWCGGGAQQAAQDVHVGVRVRGRVTVGVVEGEDARHGLGAHGGGEQSEDVRVGQQGAGARESSSIRVKRAAMRSVEPKIGG